MGININLTLDKNFGTDLENLKKYLLMKFNIQVDNKCVELILKILLYSNLNSEVVNDRILLNLVQLSSLGNSSEGQIDKPKNSKSIKEKVSVQTPRCTQLEFGTEDKNEKVSKNIKEGQYRIKPENNKDIIGKEEPPKENTEREKDNYVYDLYKSLLQFLDEE